jgi:hypothetical protein
VTLEGAGEGAVSMHPTALGTYIATAAPGSSISTERPLWRGGEAFALVATGGDVGPFRVTLTAPLTVVVTTPLNDGTRFVRGVDGLSLSWRGDAATVRLQLVDYEGEGDTVRVRCDFPGSAGHGSVPAAALAAVGAGHSAYVVALSVVEARTRTDALDLTVLAKEVAMVRTIRVE